MAYKQKKYRGKDEKGRKRDGAEKIYPSGCWRNGNQRKCVGRKWSKNENPEISSTGAEEFLLTAAGQKNRNHLEQYVRFENVSFGMEEVLYDPQTSGGLLFAVPGEVAEELRKELREAGLPAEIVGKVMAREDIEIQGAGRK